MLLVPYLCLPTRCVSQRRPSFFEVIAQDKLVSGLKPAFNHLLEVRRKGGGGGESSNHEPSNREPIKQPNQSVNPANQPPENNISQYQFKVLGRRHPTFELVHSWREEIFHSLLLFLENHYLKTTGISLTSDC